MTYNEHLLNKLVSDYPITEYPETSKSYIELEKAIKEINLQIESLRKILNFVKVNSTNSIKSDLFNKIYLKWLSSKKDYKNISIEKYYNMKSTVLFCEIIETIDQLSYKKDCLISEFIYSIIDSKWPLSGEEYRSHFEGLILDNDILEDLEHVYFNLTDKKICEKFIKQKGLTEEFNNFIDAERQIKFNK